MTINTNYQARIVHQPADVCDTYGTIAKHVNYLPCMFIAAFRSDLSREENSARNEQLAKDIFDSGLTYIRCHGHRLDTDGTEMTEDAFCVVNNGYTIECFEKLAAGWCRKLEKKAVLVTFPVREQVNQRRLLEIKGIVFNGQGGIMERMEFTNLPFDETDQCFTKAYGKSFSLDASSVIIRTSLTPPETVNGHRMAYNRFKRKYPSLF